METGSRARHRALLLVVALTAASPVLADAADDALARQIAERVPALAERAERACRAVVAPDRPAPVEIEQAIRAQFGTFDVLIHAEPVDGHTQDTKKSVYEDAHDTHPLVDPYK